MSAGATEIKIRCLLMLAGACGLLLDRKRLHEV
jgi:hypothetical protein